MKERRNGKVVYIRKDGTYKGQKEAEKPAESALSSNPYLAGGTFTTYTEAEYADMTDKALDTLFAAAARGEVDAVLESRKANEEDAKSLRDISLKFRAEQKKIQSATKTKANGTETTPWGHDRYTNNNDYDIVATIRGQNIYRRKGTQRNYNIATSRNSFMTFNSKKKAAEFLEEWIKAGRIQPKQLGQMYPVAYLKAYNNANGNK